MTLALGVDIGGTNTKLGLIDPEGRIVRDGSVSTDPKPEKVVGAIAAWAKGTGISMAGVGVPAPLDLKREKVVWAVNLGWKDTPLRKMLAKALRVPVVIENDANVAAFGEWRAGAAQGVPSCAVYTLGTGVGGGIIINGQLLIGDTGFAAELGHVIVDPHGPECGCGNRGDVEAYAGGVSIIRRYKSMTGQNGLQPRDVFERARKGEEAAGKLVDEAARALGIAIAGLAHTINPSVVVLTGGMAKAGAFYLKKIRKEARAVMYKQCSLDILLGKLGDNAGVVGAAFWAREKCH
jgi:glucokinase